MKTVIRSGRSAPFLYQYLATAYTTAVPMCNYAHIISGINCQCKPRKKLITNIDHILQLIIPSHHPAHQLSHPPSHHTVTCSSSSYLHTIQLINRHTRQVIIPSHAPAHHTFTPSSSSNRHTRQVIIPSHAPVHHTFIPYNSLYHHTLQVIISSHLQLIITSHSPICHTITTSSSSYHHMLQLIIPSHPPAHHTITHSSYGCDGITAKIRFNWILYFKSVRFGCVIQLQLV